MASLEHTRLVLAEQSVQLVSKLREDLRNACLAYLSDVRMQTAGKLESNVRDALLDGLKAFNPDDAIGDLITDAFTDAETLAERDVEDALNELGLSRRRAGYAVAAE